jgi:hypothetical protein
MFPQCGQTHRGSQKGIISGFEERKEKAWGIASHLSWIALRKKVGADPDPTWGDLNVFFFNTGE